MNRVKGLLIISGLFLSFSLFAVDQDDVAGFATDSCTTPDLGSAASQWSGWEADVLNQWNLKTCWDDSFVGIKQECPVWEIDPCFDLRVPTEICRGVEIRGGE